MKRLIFLLISLVATLSLSAQVQTVITGKIINKPNKPVILLIYNFDTAGMREKEIRIDSLIHPDNTFRFTTDKITRPFTRCRIGFSNEGQQILLSPGDTLTMEFQYGVMDTSAVFAGKGAGINDYLKQYQLKFNDFNERMIYGGIQTRDSQLILALTGWKDQKIALLDSVSRLGTIDSAFYRHELSRIQYEYFRDLISPGLMVTDKTIEYDNRVTGILGQRNFTNDEALFDFREYRDFIQEYVDRSARLIGGGDVTLQDRIDHTDMHLTGLTKTFCQWNLVSEAIRHARDPREKALLKKYFLVKTDDSRLTALLDTITVNQTFRNGMNFRRLVQPAVTVLGFILFLLLLVFLAYRNRKLLIEKQTRLDFKLVLRLGMQAAIVILVVLYFGRYYRHYRISTSFIAVAPVLVLACALIYWLIPCYFAKNDYRRFILGLALSTLIYFVVLFFIRTAGPFHASLPGSLFFALNGWVLAVPFAFLYFYLNRLIKDKRGLNSLFSKDYLNPEFYFNLLIVCFFLTSPINRAITGHLDLRYTFYLILIAALFYLNAYLLAPKFLIRGKFGKYLLISFFVLIGTIVVVYLKNASEIYFGILKSGVRIPVTWAFMLPRSQDLYAALVVQLVIVLALIYAFVRYQVVQKSLGFNLFRNKEAELQQLRSQVNPHFLFNSLNTLYSFALKENNPKTAEYIAKLANLMRYLVDDMQKERIPAQKEISYIRDYINLQAIRSSVEHKIDIQIGIEEDQSIMIAPMLMIPFVENAFKHGINPNQVSELKVNFQMKEGWFQFVIENSVDRNFEAFYKEKGFGIGIPNVRQRLEYIYPGKHTLSIADTGDRFIVILNIAVE